MRPAATPPRINGPAIVIGVLLFSLSLVGAIAILSGHPMDGFQSTGLTRLPDGTYALITCQRARFQYVEIRAGTVRKPGRVIWQATLDEGRPGVAVLPLRPMVEGYTVVPSGEAAPQDGVVVRVRDTAGRALSPTRIDLRHGAVGVDEVLTARGDRMGVTQFNAQPECGG